MGCLLETSPNRRIKSGNRAKWKAHSFVEMHWNRQMGCATSCCDNPSMVEQVFFSGSLRHLGALVESQEIVCADLQAFFNAVLRVVYCFQSPLVQLEGINLWSGSVLR